MKLSALPLAIDANKRSTLRAYLTMLLFRFAALLTGVAVWLVTDLVVMPLRRQSTTLARIAIGLVALARPMAMLL
jgi:hypothetical protein